MTKMHQFAKSSRLRLLLGSLIVAGGFVVPAARAATTLVPTGAVWKYLDNGSNQGTPWRGTSFPDGAWLSGPAQLGYGDGDEATVVGYGPTATNKYTTTYFRRTFNVTNVSAFTTLTMRLLCDDGAVVYFNGTEVFRSNMPGGTITYTTLASTALGTPAESNFVQTALSPASLVNGANLVAVEIHQANGTSTDLSFDLELTATETATVTRGPYLQMGTPSGVTVRWRTGAATNGRVRYGTDPATLTANADNPVSTTEHEVALTGLAPDTRYYYSIGTTTETLAGGPDYLFYTAPTAASALPTRVWVIGDSGTADVNAAAVRNAYYTSAGTRYTDLLLMLGDNAYVTGTDTEYQTAVFNMYPEILRQSVVWPTIGNHDTAQSVNPPSTLPYYSIFTLPMNGEAGGVASGTEDYYSFDYGNIHFICLDSMTSDRSPNGAMLTWLQSDLAADSRDWTIAFWHHPPYTKGSHNSDTEIELVEMRQNALPILEDFGVDLVLCGHSHSYERSFLLDGHYGTSDTLTAQMKKDARGGREDATGAYAKPNAPAPHEGAVYVVAGSSGKISGGLLNHPAMYVSLNELGSLVLDINTNRLDAKFLTSTGATNDYFTILKSAPSNSPPTVTLTSPAEGATFQAPAAITIAAEAADSDGTVSQVSFYAGTTLIGTDSSSPFSTAWINVAAGNYTLTAIATDNLGMTTTSGPVHVTVNVPSAPPVAPGNLYATAVSSNRIDLAWSDNSTNENGFAIERSADGVNFSQITTVAANLTSYSNTGLTASTTYFYRVRAFNNAGSSSYSNVASATTAALSAPPAAPANLAATPISKNRINLVWSDLANNETGFKIERSLDGTSFTQVGTVGANVTSFASTGLQANTKYYYRVRANNSAGNSAYSNIASALTLKK
jgi:hypothetical protein